jgi:glycerophosphoryl diester phosphodiesterase
MASMPPPTPMRPWPYPRWIAHRGAGQWAPENTLAALRAGARRGYRMAECDVQLSADGVPFLLHDERLERTTDGDGLALEQPWSALARLDAGRWHSPAYAGEPLPTLAAVARLCHETGLMLNLEIKPPAGEEARQGTVIAAHAARLWQGADTPPLLTSFSQAALQAARDSAPGLPRGLLVERIEDDGWRWQAQALGCVAVVLEHRLWSGERLGQATEVGCRALAYTVNDAGRAADLLALGLDGLITDRIDALGPD